MFLKFLVFVIILNRYIWFDSGAKLLNLGSKYVYGKSINEIKIEENRKSALRRTKCRNLEYRIWRLQNLNIFFVKMILFSLYFYSLIKIYFTDKRRCLHGEFHVVFTTFIILPESRKSSVFTGEEDKTVCKIRTTVE